MMKSQIIQNRYKPILGDLTFEVSLSSAHLSFLQKVMCQQSQFMESYLLEDSQKTREKLSFDLYMLIDRNTDTGVYNYYPCFGSLMTITPHVDIRYDTITDNHYPYQLSFCNVLYSDDILITNEQIDTNKVIIDQIEQKILESF